MPSQPIRIIALTGFLGSGKTTLMNYLLEHNQGLKIGVVVNDYGDINIDSQLVKGQTDTTLELTNGCICCSMESLELDEAIGQFSYPGSAIDYIIIEASGLAEPADLAHTLRQAMTPQTRLDSIVAVIDAANWQYSRQSRHAVANQIEYSDFVVINKTDLVGHTELGQLKALIAGINDRIRCFNAVNAAIDVRLLFGNQTDRLTPLSDTELHNHSAHQHLHEEYASTSFTSPHPLDPMTFQVFVNDQIPPAVYRAKGIVNLGAKGHNRKYRFQLVGKRAELTWTEWGDEQPRTELVFIGMGFDTTGVRNLVAACIDTHPNAIDPAKRIALPQDRG